jgi:3-carboxy-cis,cis-muconate cycloisomerase
MLDAMLQDFERATGPWQAEWIALPDSFILAAGALRQARFMLEGLVVDAARMRANLDLTKGLIVAEAVMMGLASHFGRQEAHDRVYAACRLALAQNRPLYEVLAGDRGIIGVLGTDRLRQLCDPANYVGAAADMVDAVVARRRKP